MCACRSPVGSRAGEDTSGEEQRAGEQFEASPEHNWGPNSGNWSMYKFTHFCPCSYPN